MSDDKLGALPDPADVHAGDTIAWKSNRYPYLISWGLVEQISDEGMTVQYKAAQKTMTTLVPWERLRRHWPGRAEFDRRLS